MAWRLVFACEFAVGEALPGNLTHGQRKALSVVFVLAIVEPENLFVNVAFKMKRLYSNVGSAQAALQQRPEVFKAVRMNATTDILFGVVNHIMHDAGMQLVIAHSVIRVNRRTILNVIQDRILQSLALDIRYDIRPDFAQVAVEDSLHNGLASMYSALLHKTQLAFLVHVLSESADECFIGFKFGVRSAHFFDSAERSGTQRHAEPLKHEPCRLLGHADSAVNLHAADPVLAVDQHPKRCHPLVHAKGRIFKDRVDLERELLIASTAQPKSPRSPFGFASNVIVRVRTATWANDLAIRPTQLDGVLEGAVRIGEVNDGFL